MTIRTGFQGGTVGSATPSRPDGGGAGEDVEAARGGPGADRPGPRLRRPGRRARHRGSQRGRRGARRDPLRAHRRGRAQRRARVPVHQPGHRHGGGHDRCRVDGVPPRRRGLEARARLAERRAPLRVGGAHPR